MVAGSGFLPPSFTGAITVVSLGGPATFFGPIPSAALTGAAASARVISVVNGNDVVPRLLGSKLAFTRNALLALTKSSNARKQRQNEQLLNTLEEYTLYPKTELVFLHNDTAQLVPPPKRDLVLHLAEAIHPRCIADHLSYVKAVEGAAKTSHWTPPKAALQAA